MNLKKYLDEVANLHSVQLVIVGKDPYPNDATDIPFLKTRMDALFKPSCSGGIVLEAIGCNADFLCEKYKDDKEGTLKLFLALRDKGIVFLNAIYRTQNVGRKIRKRHDFNELMNAYSNYNEPVLQKAQHVIYCGEAKKVQQWVQGSPQVDDKNIHAVPHPDKRNSYSKRDEVQAKYKKWWSPGKLQRNCNLELPKGVTP
jgi:uracil DNA glycosylase